MLEGGTLERYVLAPSKVLDGSEMNAVANTRRQGLLVEGRGVWAAKNEDLVPKKTKGLYQQQETDGDGKQKKKRGGKKGKDAGMCL